ncbi:MAG TPA: hypothetical protein VFO11_11065 [Candidatus Polarisedimenticolaceae bacterium]|nr:hypothetical protein [Candidatus Polarisedimenticolaceae bacterium]
MFPRTGCLLASVVSAASLGVVCAQEPPPAAKPPVDTSVPGTQLRTTFLPTATLNVHTNGNVNVVGEEKQSAVGMGVGLTLPLNWVKERSSYSLTYSTGMEVYGNEHHDAEDIPHNLSMSYHRTASRKVSWGFNLNGTRSEQQRFDINNPEQPTTLVPRTSVTHGGAGLSMNLTTGERSSIGMSISGGVNRFEDIPPQDLNGNGVIDSGEDANGNGVLDAPEDLNGNNLLDPGEDVNGNGVLDPGEDTNGNGVLDAGEPRGALFFDSTYGGANLSWSLTVSQRTTMGMGYQYNLIRYQDIGGPLPDDLLKPLDTDVHNLYLDGARRFSEYTSGSIQLGVLVAQQDASEDRVEPSVSASLQRQVSQESSLSIGLQQSAGAGSGRGVATLDRGLFGSWNWARPTISFNVALGFWDRATLISPFSQAGTSTTFQISENFGYTPGQRFSYGVFHSFRDQQADDPLLEAKGYHSGGVFVRWNIRGRSAQRVG